MIIINRLKLAGFQLIKLLYINSFIKIKYCKHYFYRDDIPEMIYLRSGSGLSIEFFLDTQLDSKLSQIKSRQTYKCCALLQKSSVLGKTRECCK